MENQKSESDRKLIANLTGVDPLDWSKRENGDLVYLNQAGQKFILTSAEIEKLTHKEKSRSVSQERNAEIPEERQPQAASTEGNRHSHHKKDESVPEEKELTENQAPYDAEANVP